MSSRGSAFREQPRQKIFVRKCCSIDKAFGAVCERILLDPMRRHVSRKEKKNRQECTLQQAVQCTWTASSTPIWAYLDGSVVLDGLKLVNVELQFHRESNGHRRMIKEEEKTGRKVELCSAMQLRIRNTKKRLSTHWMR